MQKAFRVFLYLKFTQPSRFKDVKGALKGAEGILGLKYQTIRKHFNELVQKQWIGKDDKGHYYLRSIQFLRLKYRSKYKRAVSMTYDDLPNCDAFIAAAYLKHLVTNQQMVKNMYYKRRKQSLVSIKRQDAAQREWITSISYNGISSKGLAMKLGISRTSAQRLMQESAQCKYIRINQKKEKLLSNATPGEISAFKLSDTVDNHKLRYEYKPRDQVNGFDFSKMTADTHTVHRFDVYLQLHNEIKPNIDLRVLRGWPSYRMNSSAIVLS